MAQAVRHWKDGRPSWTAKKHVDPLLPHVKARAVKAAPDGRKVSRVGLHWIRHTYDEDVQQVCRNEP